MAPPERRQNKSQKLPRSRGTASSSRFQIGTRRSFCSTGSIYFDSCDLVLDKGFSACHCTARTVFGG
ncbi:hypothetical protein WJX84_011971 [Apatococcus fuscideae]|uniref:Uncharacterized protein n=1 Tax=Apatococcus fuscideae TaxID=2026836 RepID=A0AAW1T4W3_9CHLO